MAIELKSAWPKIAVCSDAAQDRIGNIVFHFPGMQKNFIFLQNSDTKKVICPLWIVKGKIKKCSGKISIVYTGKT
jgi:hypothetical protein